MVANRFVVWTLVWFALLTLLGVVVTCAVFAAFVPGPERGRTFYIAAGIVCCGEVGFLLHLAHMRLARQCVPTATPPARIQVQSLTVVWLVVAIIAAVVSLGRTTADTFYADRIFMIYLVLTFLPFVGAYFIYTKDMELEREDHGLAKERREVLFNVPDVEIIMRIVKEAGRQHPECASLAATAYKRLDTLRSALEGILVSATSSAQGRNWNAEIAAQVTKLVSLSTVPDDAAQASEVLGGIARQAEVILSVVGKRERALLA